MYIESSIPIFLLNFTKIPCAIRDDIDCFKIRFFSVFFYLCYILYDFILMRQIPFA